jgi:hypothetical protein
MAVAGGSGLDRSGHWQSATPRKHHYPYGGDTYSSSFYTKQEHIHRLPLLVQPIPPYHGSPKLKLNKFHKTAVFIILSQNYKSKTQLYKTTDFVSIFHKTTYYSLLCLEFIALKSLVL